MNIEKRYYFFEYKRYPAVRRLLRYWADNKKWYKIKKARRFFSKYNFYLSKFNQMSDICCRRFSFKLLKCEFQKRLEDLKGLSDCEKNTLNNYIVARWRDYYWRRKDE